MQSKVPIIVGDKSKPTKLDGGQVIINKKATAKEFDKLVEINNSTKKPTAKVTTDGTDGGILKGKPHYDKNGKPLGGIPAIVSGGKQIEVENNEFVVNAEAAKKHWRELSKINQSAGGGVPIERPEGGVLKNGGAVSSELKKGIKVEGEHAETIRDIFNRRINPEQAPKRIALDHIKENPKYYTKLMEMESKFEDGGNTENTIKGLTGKEAVYLYVKRALKQPFRESYLRPIGLWNNEAQKQVEANLIKKGLLNSAGAINETGKNLAKEIDNKIGGAISSGFISSMDKREKYNVVLHKFSEFSESEKMADGGNVGEQSELEELKKKLANARYSMRNAKSNSELNSANFDIDFLTKKISEIENKSSKKPFVFPEILKTIMPKEQQELLKSIGYDEHEQILTDLAAHASKLKSRNDNGGDSIMYLHYFYGNMDWYVSEWRKTDGIFFGFANLGDDQNAEFGTAYVTDLTETRGIELDFFFDPTPIKDINVGGNFYYEEKVKEPATKIVYSAAELAYDYNGTKTIEFTNYFNHRNSPVRKISIPEDNFRNQVDRYSSGNNGYFTEEQWNKLKDTGGYTKGIATAPIETEPEKPIKYNKYDVGDSVKYKVGDMPEVNAFGVIQKVVDLGNEYAYRVDAYFKDSDGNILFSDEKNTEVYESQLTLSTGEMYEVLRNKYNALRDEKTKTEYGVEPKFKIGDRVKVKETLKSTVTRMYDDGIVIKYDKFIYNSLVQRKDWLVDVEILQDKHNELYWESELELVHTEPKEKTFKERINVDKTAENFADIRQSLDEFFTPEYVAEIMYKLAVKHGYKGGSLLEPSFGHGVFFDVAKKHGIKEELFYGFELYKPNYDFVKKEYPRANLFNHNFEYQFIDKDIFFKKNNIERSNKFANMQFDLVLGNPPYGKHKSPHSYYFSDKMQIRYEGFFIYLALKKLKKDGLLVFIINSLWLQNGNLYNEQKKEIEKYGELIDAYRLPNKTFADTDIATDIVIFRRK